MTTVAPARLIPRFEPRMMRRRLTGTAFYGACVFAIGLLLLALVALLVDVFVRAAPWLDVQFLTSFPSSRPE
jgi:phosphate transport system permease protein